MLKNSLNKTVDTLFPSTIHKLSECNYFLGMMLHEYHDPFPFQLNLNAFIQGLRNVTFMLQSEEQKPDGFEEWYKVKQSEMSANPLLRNFIKTRNLIVKRQMLEAKSECKLGIFRGRKFKIGVGGEVPPGVDTFEYLKRAQSFFIGKFIDAEHSCIGEQLGVERKWVVEDIGEGEVATHCAKALEAIGEVVSDALVLKGSFYYSNVDLPDLQDFSVLLESDVDPSLREKWGW